jgi:hypothetical protein
MRTRAKNEIRGMADLGNPQQCAENAAKAHEGEDNNTSHVCRVRRVINFRRKLRFGGSYNSAAYDIGKDASRDNRLEGGGGGRTEPTRGLK